MIAQPVDSRDNFYKTAQPTTAPMVSPDYHREAEQIVREEREQKERMPSYKVCTVVLENDGGVRPTYTRCVIGSGRIPIGGEDG